MFLSFNNFFILNVGVCGRYLSGRYLSDIVRREIPNLDKIRKLLSL